MQLSQTEKGFELWCQHVNLIAMARKNTPNIGGSLWGVGSWFLGGVSLLHIIDQVSPVQLMGKLATWIDAYAELVESLRHFLLGWINWRWVNISDTEAHLIVFGSILITSAYRFACKLYPLMLRQNYHVLHYDHPEDASAWERHTLTLIDGTPLGSRRERYLSYKFDKRLIHTFTLITALVHHPKNNRDI